MKNYIDMRIRLMTDLDTREVIEMMRIFYHSPAVHSDGSEEIYEADVENCVNDNPYLEGYIFECENGIMGYGMVAKSFSTEFGKPCIWIEDLYIKEDYRGFGIGKEFLQYIDETYPDAVIRLEAEEENERAVYVYRKSGFQELPYMELVKR